MGGSCEELAQGKGFTFDICMRSTGGTCDGIDKPEWTGEVAKEMSPKHEQTEVFRRVCGLWGVWDAGESAARFWPGLGVQERLASWWKMAAHLGWACFVEYCRSWLLPSSLLGCSMVRVLQEVAGRGWRVPTARLKGLHSCLDGSLSDEVRAIQGTLGQLVSGLA